MSEHTVNLEELTTVLFANICVYQIGQPRSAPFLLDYTPLVGNFLESLIVPWSQKVRVEPTTLFVAQPATTILPKHPDLIPTGEVLEMAPPINAYELMGKKSKGAPKGKGKAKEGAQAKKPRRAVFEVIMLEQSAHSVDSGSAVPEEQTQPPLVVELDAAEEVADPALRPKRPKVVVETTQHPGPSSSKNIWAPEMMLGKDLISVHHFVLNTSDVELSAKVAHALTGATCLPKDIQAWDKMYSGQIHRHISWGLVMVSS